MTRGEGGRMNGEVGVGGGGEIDVKRPSNAGNFSQSSKKCG